MPALGRFLQLSDPLLCAQSAEVDALADRLGSLTPSSDELSRYWVEFTGEDTPEADQLMTDAWGWLKRLVRAGTQSDWCVLLEGSAGQQLASVRVEEDGIIRPRLTSKLLHECFSLMPKHLFHLRCDFYFAHHRRPSRSYDENR